MASKHEYFLYIMELLREIDGISYKKMMGEYILCKNNVIFGGIYDNRFLVKNTKSLSSYRFKKVIPYSHAKAMLLIDSEDPDEIKEIVELVYQDLKNNN